MKKPEKKYLLSMSEEEYDTLRDLLGTVSDKDLHLYSIKIKLNTLLPFFDKGNLTSN